MAGWLRGISVVCIIASTLAGCAQSKTYTPRVAPVAVHLHGLQANRVAVEVSDLRAEGAGRDSMPAILRVQLESALGRDDSARVDAKARLLVDVIEHRSFFTMGTWHATTRLRARLVAPDGTVSGPWAASGSGHRSNMNGYQTAKAVSQDAYGAALSDLLSALNAVSLRK